MREILFRAKRIDNGEWVEGQYAYILNSKTENGEPIKHFICNGTNVFNYEVDPETLCQYTGLKDKNGNRIWENDIVSINTYSYMEPEEDYFGKVVYAEGYACWCIQHPDYEKPIPLCECEGSYQTDRIIEGNIFDNPELLKGDQSCTDL